MVNCPTQTHPILPFKPAVRVNINRTLLYNCQFLLCTNDDPDYDDDNNDDLTDVAVSEYL